MGKPTGFLEWDRAPAPRRPIALRVHDWAEVGAHDAEQDVRRQAGRCMDCGVPFCMQGCPLGNPIPDFNHRAWTGDWADAWRRLSATNNFPELTGRLCPAPCEAACVLALDGAAVTIEHLEQEIADRAFAAGLIVPQPARVKTGKRVAIVGSGPAGLAAAQQLARAGHAVVVYEADDRPGGLLRRGIPDFKLDKAVLDRRLAQLEAEGVDFRCGVRVGEADAPSWDELRATHDALVLAIGAQVARELHVPGRDLDGVLLAMEYLDDQNRVVAGQRARALHDVGGQRVIILGGGDTGSDCLGTALRQGAASVHQVELLPAPPAERAAGNPWPAWPVVFRTSSSQEEGGARDFALRTLRLDGDAGRLVALVAERLTVTLAARGRVPTVADLVSTGEEVRLPCDRLILALGFTGPATRALTAQLGVALDARGNVATDASFATSVPGVFACGDAHRGASLIVWAIAEGREAARACDAHLRAAPSVLPSLGVDQPFFPAR
ncbi:MAG TPA: glutamate synthase subunit beta [Kofleriaceae bacterium]|nr:glutamate synthase subunit beta [Kofleriaceae bacterium]